MTFGLRGGNIRPVDNQSTPNGKRGELTVTNTTLLKEKIDASGYKMKYIANRIGLSYQGFLNKIRNKTDFTAPEIKSLCELLHIGTEEMEQIFFAP